MKESLNANRLDMSPLPSVERTIVNSVRVLASSFGSADVACARVCPERMGQHSDMLV